MAVLATATAAASPGKAFPELALYERTVPNGRLLLSYGLRNDGDWGINVRIGNAEGRDWSAPMRLVDLEGSTDRPDLEPKPQRDGGYPSTVVLKDGTLVTAYYSRGVPAHQRYHVGVVRWRMLEAK